MEQNLLYEIFDKPKFFWSSIYKIMFYLKTIAARVYVYHPWTDDIAHFRLFVDFFSYFSKMFYFLIHIDQYEF